MLNFEWKPLSSAPTSFEDLKHILLKNRNLSEDFISSENSLGSFLKDPKKLGFEASALIIASDILKHLLDRKKGIVIHGDYDVDGITSTAILYEGLVEIGFENGYGFSESSYSFIKNNYPVTDYPLIVLTDCGITSIDMVSCAIKDGYKVIIIDHHKKKKQLPNANAVFWNDAYTASVLSYFFTKYMQIKLTGKTELYNGVDLAGLGFIADLGDLRNLVGNVLTKEALKQMNTNLRKGIKLLLDHSNYSKDEITSYDLGWIIGPRLNAMGRMSDPSHSLNLLIADDELNDLAYLLDSTNKERQEVTKELYEEAVLGLSNNKFIGLQEEHRLSIVHSENFHEGVIGLISSKLVRSLYKPSICISWESDIGKGSCRSVEGVNIVALLDSVSDLLEGFGGHTMAAGFSIKRSNYKKFEEKLLKSSKKLIEQDYLKPFYYFDCTLKGSFLTLELLEFIDSLEPFGNGNPVPSFVLKNVHLQNSKLIGKDETHLSFELPDNSIRGIFFGGSKYKELADNGVSVDILFNFNKNVWKGNLYPQLFVKDIKPSDQF